MMAQRDLSGTGVDAHKPQWEATEVREAWHPDQAVLSSVRKCIEPEKTVGRKEITQEEKSSLLYC